MQLDRQTGNNYGTIKTAYLAAAMHYDAIIAANGGSGSGFSAAVLNQYFHKVEFEFEQGTWRENPNRSGHGTAFNYEVLLKVRQMNAPVRAWRSHWLNRQVLALIYDHQGNEILFGSADEPFDFLGGKETEQRATSGAFYDAVISGSIRFPV